MSLEVNLKVIKSKIVAKFTVNSAKTNNKKGSQLPKLFLPLTNSVGFRYKFTISQLGRGTTSLAEEGKVEDLKYKSGIIRQLRLAMM